MKKAGSISIAALSLAGLLFSGCAKEGYLSKSKSGDDAMHECQKLSENKEYDAANECFELLKSRFSGSQAAFEADLDIGDNYFRKKDYLLAAETYLAFAKLHPTHEKIGYAYYRIGLSYLRESPKAIARDQEYLTPAIHYLELAMGDPDPQVQALAREKWIEARTRIAKRDFYIGRFYYKTGEYLSAIPRFEEVVSDYSGLGLDEKSLYLLAKSYRGLSEKDKANEILGVLEQHFPKSPYRERLARELGEH